MTEGKVFAMTLDQRPEPPLAACGGWDGLILGEEQQALECQLGEYVGAAHCVGTDSAFAGFLLALSACGVAREEYVFCPALDCGDGVRAVRYLGARPLFVDVNPNTLNLDASCLEYAIKKLLRQKETIPRVAIVSDAYGLPCNYDALEAVCAKYGLSLVEDMTKSFGAAYRGRRTGAFGRFAVTSFSGAAPLGGLEEGGAVFCRTRQDRDCLEELRARSAALQQQLGGAAQVSRCAGAGVMSEKLRVFHQEFAKRQAVAARYRDNLRGMLKVQQVGEHYTSAYAQFVVVVRDEESRRRILDKLRANHIPAQVPKEAPPGGMPVNAALLVGRILALPLHPYLSGHVVDFVCQCLADCTREEAVPVCSVGGEPPRQPAPI